MSKVYRNFQIYVAPGAYAGFALIGGFSFFILDSIVSPVAATLILFALTYLDLPLRANLFYRPILAAIHILFILTCCFLPAAFVIYKADNEGQFIATLLAPVLSLVFACFLAFIHTTKKLDEMGWVNINGSLE